MLNADNYVAREEGIRTRPCLLLKKLKGKQKAREYQNGRCTHVRTCNSSKRKEEKGEIILPKRILEADLKGLF